MTIDKQQQQIAEGTGQAPHYYEGPTHIHGDVRLHQRLFSYETNAGLVAGWNMSVMFTIDRSAKEVWPYLKDFNLWQNSYDYYYTGVVGDLYSSQEGNLGEKTFRIGSKPNNPESLYPFEYKVLRVIPERLIVIFQPVPEDGSNGGVSPGFHVFMLSEHDGKTVVTIEMEHANRSQGKTEEEAVGIWREAAPEIERFWRDIFIPDLKKLVHKGK